MENQNEENEGITDDLFEPFNEFVEAGFQAYKKLGEETKNALPFSEYIDSARKYIYEDLESEEEEDTSA